MNPERTDNLYNVLQKLYKYLFWTGYSAVFITTFIPIAGSLSKVKLGPESFHIRLDQLIHFVVYFLICMYYLAGQRRGFSLFSENPLTKFILLVLLLAIVTELVQLWVPERAFNVFDMVANVGGVIIGLGVIKMVQWHKGSKMQRH